MLRLVLTNSQVDSFCREFEFLLPKHRERYRHNPSAGVTAGDTKVTMLNGYREPPSPGAHRTIC